jgi:hypothetical protein
MGEAKSGDEFIKHEFDEAIAIQQAIVTAEQRLAKIHPLPDAKTALADAAKEDAEFLRKLKALGKPWGATGVAEEVAEALQELAEETGESAAEAPSEAYEAQAVVVNMKRKQQDSAAGMLEIARSRGDEELMAAASEFGEIQKAGAQTLADSLAAFAVVIASATEPEDGKSGSSKSRSTRAQTASR